MAAPFKTFERRISVQKQQVADAARVAPERPQQVVAAVKVLAAVRAAAVQVVVVGAVVAVVAEAVVAARQRKVTLGKSELPRLGVGLGYRDAVRTDVFRNANQIDFLEITADHFFDPKPESNELLKLLASRFPLIPHGLGLSLGSADGLDRGYLNMLKRVVETVQPAWWSEHISFCRVGGIDIGHLTALPKTKATLRCLKENIRVATSEIGAPLILENITQSIEYENDTFDEASFLGEVLNENNCGLLLDVTNLYINSINYRFDAVQVLNRLPRDRIVQLHFVGFDREGDLLKDGHSHSTNLEIWQLLEEVVRYAPVCGAILERDEQLPPFSDILTELANMREIMNRDFVKT